MKRALFATMAVIVPRAALACPVCFGQNDSPLALGINYGILAMIGFIGSVLAGFAAFFIYLMRRARLVEQQSAAGGAATATAGAANPGALPHAIGRVPQAQEGTI